MKNELREKGVKTKRNFQTLSKTALWHSLSQNVYPFEKDPQFVLDREIDILDIISGFSTVAKTKKTIEEMHRCFNHYATKLGYAFTGICKPDETLDRLVVKTYRQGAETEVFQISMSDADNYLVQTYLDKSKKFASYRDLYYLNNPDVRDYLIIPLVLNGECSGLVIAGSIGRERSRDEVLNALCGYFALLLNNHSLQESINSQVDYDSLTGFYTHRKFQGILSETLVKAEKNNRKISIAIYDINNITGINREYGYSHGDNVIAGFAGMLKSSLRKEDIAARYGGDEIAVIMPDTDNEEALLLTQQAISDIYRQNVEGIGHIKASVGIATYPTTAQEQEKLLLLAEQSMLISGDKANKKGEAFAVSSKDVNFWNKIALDSLSKVINKRNLHHRFSFEDELVKQLHSEDPYSEVTMEVVTSLAAAIDAKDTYTKGHSQSVSFYSEMLAKAVGLDENMVKRIKLAAELHDVGKIGISESILRKPGPLTDHEWEVMKQHPIIAVKKILEPVKSLNDLIPIVRHHHERIDGYGYPDRLKGDEIPFGAKIVAVADAFHAMISNRPYRKASSVEKALDILRTGAGKQWDSGLVEKFIELAPSFYLTRK